MVPDLIWAPYFFCSQEFFDPREKIFMQGPAVCAKPITEICPITPTVVDPITKMKVAGTQMKSWTISALYRLKIVEV